MHMGKSTYKNLSGEKIDFTYESRSSGDYADCYYVSRFEVFLAVVHSDTAKELLSTLSHPNLPKYERIGTLGGYRLYKCKRYNFYPPTPELAKVAGYLYGRDTLDPDYDNLPPNVAQALKLIEPYVHCWDFKQGNIAFDGNDIILLDVFVGKQ